jgi:hypothetical protein
LFNDDALWEIEKATATVISQTFNHTSNKTAEPITLLALHSAAESEIAFARLFFTVAKDSYRSGKKEAGDRARSVAKSACNVLDELLKEIEPAAELTLSTDLHGLRTSLDSL